MNCITEKEVILNAKINRKYKVMFLLRTFVFEKIDFANLLNMCASD